MDQKQQPRHSRRGNYSMLMGVMSFVVIGFGALAVDISLITMSELQAQATADAASHAALVAYRESSVAGNSGIGQAEGNMAAAWILSHNKIGMGFATMDPGFPEYGQWDYLVGSFKEITDPREGINATQVHISRTNANAVQMLLAPLLGYNKHDVRADSITSQQNRAVMLIQDMSCSMMTGRPVTATDISAVEHSRRAQMAFVQYLAEHPQPGDRLGLAMFAQTAAPQPIGPHPWASACGGDNYCPTGRPMGTQEPWLPLQRLDNPVVVDRVNGICDTMIGQVGDLCNVTARTTLHLNPRIGASWNDVGDCTNPEIAILQAIDELLLKTDSTYFRAIVFMSDGVPNCDIDGVFRGTAMGRALRAANVAEAEGIRLYTVLYHNGDFNADFMLNTGADSPPGLVRNGGFGVSSKDASDLEGMFIQIAKSFPTAFMD